jgi:hypothetical protein
MWADSREHTRRTRRVRPTRSPSHSGDIASPYSATSNQNGMNTSSVARFNWAQIT